jgi:hypothetical protein
MLLNICCSYRYGIHRFFKPVGIQKDEIDKRSFLKLSFVNKGIEGINLGNILHNKSSICQIQP